MTQGRNGISLAALRLFSIVAATFAIAALIASSAGTSYAKSKKSAKHHNGPGLEDTVSVTNYGAILGGSLETFLGGAGHNAKPFLWVKGTNTLLGATTGPAGLSVGSLDDHIAVTVPIDILDMTGFGGFPNTLACAGPENPVPCCTGKLTGDCGAGTGFAEIFSPGANGNSVPENVIGTRNVTFDNTGCSSPGIPLPCCTGPNNGTCAFNTAGINTPQGVAFEDPFDGVNPGHDIVAIANTLPINFFSTSDFLDGTNGGAACAAFGGGGPGMTVGTITEFDRSTLAPGFNDTVAPFNNNPVCTLPAVDIPPDFDEPPTSCPIGSNYNATIGGCLTFLLGPVALAFDQSGFLFAVNEAGVASGGPGFVTAYTPAASGDAFPFAVIGLTGTTAGAFVDPAKIAVLSDSDFSDDIIAVSDVGDNSVKIFAPFTEGCEAPPNFFCTGDFLGEIKGGATKFKRPEGLAIGSESGALYVVNNNSNTLEMFTDFEGIVDGGGDIPPTLIISGKTSKLNFPVDVALPAFTPSGSPTETEIPSGTPTETIEGRVN